MSGESEAAMPEATGGEGIRELLADRTLVVVLCLSFVGGAGGAAGPALPGIASAFGVSGARVWLAPAPGALYAILALYGVDDSLYNPVLSNAVTGMTDAEYRGRVVSLMEVLKAGALTLSPVVFGAALAAVDFESMSALAAAVAAVPAVPTLLVVGD